MKTPFIVIVVSLASALMGCGSSDGGHTKGSTPTPIEVPPPNGEPEPTPEPASIPDPAVVQHIGSQITVVPWNGAQAAVSLTFDDGDGSQLDNAVPVLDAKDLDATFFITETAITGRRKDDWKALAARGHEIGNHSKHHYAPSDNPSEAHERTFDDTLGYEETIAAKADIEQAMETTVFTYAYPYTNNEPFIVKYLHDTHVSARGGWGANGTYYMNSSYTPDWMNVSCLFSWTEGRFDKDYRSWVDDAIAQKAWIVFGIHGVGDINWTSFPQQEFNLTVDYLDEKRAQVWIAPYGTISSYWRAQKIIEGLTAKITSSGARYTWEVPAHFPSNINLKVKLKDGEGYQLIQNGNAIQPDEDGNYAISFAAESLELTHN